VEIKGNRREGKKKSLLLTTPRERNLALENFAVRFLVRAIERKNQGKRGRKEGVPTFPMGNRRTLPEGGILPVLP